MNRQISDVLEKVTDELFGWDTVDTATLMSPPADVYDPYFFLSIDVYFRESVPDAAVRRDAFSFAGAFESGASNRKDRFLIGDIPVRLEYKDIARFDEIVRGSRGTMVAHRDSGTYPLYRLEHSEVLRQRSDWIDGIRTALGKLEPGFWTSISDAAQARMEHYLSDLGASVQREDHLFFLVSSAGFIRSLCSLLFSVNRMFEPSSRTLWNETFALRVLPESFRGRFDAFLRAGSDVPPDRKFEIAGHLALSTIGLRLA